MKQTQIMVILIRVPHHSLHSDVVVLHPVLVLVNPFACDGRVVLSPTFWQFTRYWSEPCRVVKIRRNYTSP